MTYVWYAGYGSNLYRERFLTYINGGRFKLGGKEAKGCDDNAPPISDEPITISFPMYFSRNSAGWNYGGVAFIDISGESGLNSNVTYGRMWKITKDQFHCVHDQESRSLYDMEVPLGTHKDGCRIITFTSSDKTAIQKPSEQYLTTIALGLKETYRLEHNEIINYLLSIQGIYGLYTRNELETMISQ